jgi:uncharacterized membrane protein YeaQ/YmgE (transglycosylase-associated protein family)
VDFDPETLIPLAVVGLLAGSISSRIAVGKDGLGLTGNLLVGVAGALLAGVLTDALDLDLGLPSMQIELSDVVMAAGGSMILLVFVIVIKKQMAKNQK